MANGKIYANLVSYPGRVEQLPLAVASIAPQVDEVRLVLNDYTAPPEWVAEFDNVTTFLSPEDLRDTGKFVTGGTGDDYVVYCDDDILYPEDYVSTLISAHEKFAPIGGIVGVHGTIYSDYYEGIHRSGRMTDAFMHALSKDRVVNQLGTGTILCRGDQCPDFDYMRDSQQFVDVRFARYARQQGAPLIAVRREKGWLRALPVENSIYEDFTATCPEHVIREISTIAGFAKLDLDAVKFVSDAQHDDDIAAS